MFNGKVLANAWNANLVDPNECDFWQIIIIVST